jgi:hypothetical protein
MKRVVQILVFTVLISVPSGAYGQKENLPIIKANSTRVDIKEDDVLKKNIWRIAPEICCDVYQTSAKEVTFYTDIDSISFVINPKAGKYDFIILLNEKDSARTQIKYQRPSRDEMIKRHYTNSFDFFTIIATNKPENFDPRAINQSFRHSASFVIPFGVSNFSVAIGAGISFHNYYIDALPKEVIPSSMQLGEHGDFIKIESISNPKINYKKNKMTLTYLDIPLELRYRSKKGFKVSAGAKIDFLVKSCFKFKGTDYLFGSHANIKIKKYNLEDLSNIQIGPIVRMGWNRLHVFATYSFTPVYNTDAGGKLNPICVGISLTPKN